MTHGVLQKEGSVQLRTASGVPAQAHHTAAWVMCKHNNVPLSTNEVMTAEESFFFRFVSFCIKLTIQPVVSTILLVHPIRQRRRVV
jgi:hypothetical protein